MILFLILFMIVLFSITCTAYGIYIICQKMGYKMNVAKKNVRKYGGILKFVREA